MGLLLSESSILAECVFREALADNSGLAAPMGVPEAKAGNQNFLL